jgi:hypothetical protein
MFKCFSVVESKKGEGSGLNREASEVWREKSVNQSVISRDRIGGEMKEPASKVAKANSSSMW